MITQVTYARLYNAGNYENVRFEAQATVENDDTAAAYADASAAVHAAYAQWQADREAEEQRQREERQARYATERAAASQKPDALPF